MIGTSGRSISTCRMGLRSSSSDHVSPTGERPRTSSHDRKLHGQTQQNGTLTNHPHARNEEASGIVGGLPGKDLGKLHWWKKGEKKTLKAELPGTSWAERRGSTRIQTEVAADGAGYQGARQGVLNSRG